MILKAVLMQGVNFLVPVTQKWTGPSGVAPSGMWIASAQSSLGYWPTPYTVLSGLPEIVLSLKDRVTYMIDIYVVHISC